MILHYNWFCIDKRIDHLKWTSNNKNLYYTKELCLRFLHIHVLKNSRILYTFVRAYFAYLLLKNLRTVIVQKLQSVHWLLHVQINHDCIIIENIFNSCLWGHPPYLSPTIIPKQTRHSTGVCFECDSSLLLDSKHTQLECHWI